MFCFGYNIVVDNLCDFVNDIQGKHVIAPVPVMSSWWVSANMTGTKS